MTYCHVSAQIAQHADDCDIDVTCDFCKSDNVDYITGPEWYKHCGDCGVYEDKEGIQL
jgi:pimeloyl-CoA synthetase